MCASGAGISTASSAAEAVHVGHEERLVPERALRVQHALGRAARPRREEHRGERGGIGPSSSTPAPAPVDVVVVDRAGERAQRNVAPRDLHGRCESGDERRGLVAAGAVMDRRRDRAEAPARAVHRSTTGLELAACQHTTSPGSTPRARSQPASPATAASTSGVVIAQQLIERRDVPRTTRTRVLVGERVLVGGADRFGSGATSRPRPTGACRRGGSCR